jgi:hypothetical protein
MLEYDFKGNLIGVFNIVLKYNNHLSIFVKFLNEELRHEKLNKTFIKVMLTIFLLHHYSHS